MTPITLPLLDQRVLVPALINSGSDSEFTDESFARGLNISLLPLPQSIQVKALDERTIYPCSSQSVPIHVSIDNHHEDITFHVIRSALVPLVLGISRLHQHHPHNNWAFRRGPGMGCPCVCLHAAGAHPEEFPIHALTIRASMPLRSRTGILSHSSLWPLSYYRELSYSRNWI